MNTATTTVRNRFQNYVNNLYENFLSIAKQVQESRQNPYEISGWIKKESVEKDILIYRVTATDKYIACFSVLEIYSDDDILMGFSKMDIKRISSLAILVHYKKEPKYHTVWESFRNNYDEKMVQFEDRDNLGIVKKRIDELENDVAFIDGLSGKDAFKLGKELGLRERLKEEAFVRSCG